MIETLLRFVIAQRHLMVTLALAIIVLGSWQYQHLTIGAVPDITNTQVQINTLAPGYSPVESEQQITYPVETALYGLPNLRYTRSLSRYGLSQVTVVFDEGTDIHFARQLINIRLNTIQKQLPSGITPEMGPISTGLGEIVMYTLKATPKTAAKVTLNNTEFPLDAMALREIQDWIIKPQLIQVPGVVEVNSIGGYRKEYHVLPDLKKLLFYELSFSDLTAALAANNQNQGAGYIEQNGQQLLVRSSGQLASIQDIKQTVIATKHDLPIRIQDVAIVQIGSALRTGAATENGQEIVLGTAMMLIGENPRQVASAVTAQLEKIIPSLPQGVTLEVVYDRTTLVDKAIATVSKNLLEGALLVIVILFLLLRNLRAALITAAVIPLSMLMTITGMVQAKLSANLMSLGALDFGLIVDGAVIIVENSVRRLALAQRSQTTTLSLHERLHLVYEATAEVIKPSLFGVLIITIVYIPIFSLSGVEGKMFHPMAATVIMALLCAMLLSLTIVPAAVALFVRTPKPSAHLLQEKVAFSARIYQQLLLKIMPFRYVVFGLVLVFVVYSLSLIRSLGTEFVPQLNEGDIALHALRIPGTGLEQAVSMQNVLEKQLMQFPEVAKVFSRIGTAEVATDPMPPNVADNFVILKPRYEWPDPKKTKAQLVKEIQAHVQKIPGNNYEFTQPIQMRFNELLSGVRADLGIKLFGDDLDQLVLLANQIATVVRQVPGATDVRVEQVTGLPTLSITPKRTALARFNMTVAQLQDWVATAVKGQPAGILYQGDRRFNLVVRLPNDLRQNIDLLPFLPIPLANGDYVPLQEIATIELTTIPAQISRENGKRRIVVTANIRERDLGSFVKTVQTQISAKVSIPPGYWLNYSGVFEQLESASQRLLLIIPITLVVILGLLLLAFRSIKDALIIFSGVPFALTGGLLALYYREMPLSISAGVGFIALSGIAILNGLVMVSFIRQLWGQQRPLWQAIHEAAVTRLRPVLMTALVASLGFIPMALNTGIGAEVQKPLATVVIGGIISSTLLTLLILPLLYYSLHRGKTNQEEVPY